MKKMILEVVRGDPGLVLHIRKLTVHIRRTADSSSCSHRAHLRGCVATYASNCIVHSRLCAHRILVLPRRALTNIPHHVIAHLVVHWRRYGLLQLLFLFSILGATVLEPYLKMMFQSFFILFCLFHWDHTQVVIRVCFSNWLLYLKHLIKFSS